MKRIIYVSFIAIFCSYYTEAQENYIAVNQKKFASRIETSSGDVNPQYSLLERKLSELESIQNNGGWGKIVIPSKKRFRPGDRNATILQLKQRLYLSGYLDQPDTSSLYSKELLPFVKKLQKQ